MINEHGINGCTITRVATNAVWLLRRGSNRRGGMREENITRLVPSFVLFNITYVAAFH